MVMKLLHEGKIIKLTEFRFMDEINFMNPASENLVSGRSQGIHDETIYSTHTKLSVSRTH